MLEGRQGSKALLLLCCDRTSAQRQNQVMVSPQSLSEGVRGLGCRVILHSFLQRVEVNRKPSPVAACGAVANQPFTLVSGCASTDWILLRPFCRVCTYVTEDRRDASIAAWG